MAITLTREEDRIIDNLYMKEARPAITLEQLQRILLYSDGWFTVGGRKHIIRSERIGPGIYSVWLELAR